MPQLLLTLVFIGIGWFLLIRPQQARLREQKSLVATLSVGDQVITAGGIHGTLTQVDTETVQIRVAPGIELTLARPAVARRLDPEGVADGGSAIGNDGSGDLDEGERSAGLPGNDAEDDVEHIDDGPTSGGQA